MRIKYIADPAEIPEEPHFAIVKQFTYTDDSWDTPTNRTGLQYEVYDDEEEWKAEIIKLNKRNEKFKAIKSRGLSFQIKVDIEIKNV